MNEFSIYDAVVTPEVENTPVVVSWWAGDAYKPHADRLIRSLRRQGFHNWIMFTSSLDPRGWEANCNRKPRAIQFAMRLLKRPVLWLDADAECVRYLSDACLIPKGCDAVLMRPNRAHPGRWPLVNSTLMSGTMGFGYTVGADFLLRRWADECEKNPSAYDQETLATILAEPEYADLGFVVKDLDPRLICVPDLMPDVKDPIVIHHQASREAECRYQR